jgi:hypothetical protein
LIAVFVNVFCSLPLSGFYRISFIKINGSIKQVFKKTGEMLCSLKLFVINEPKFN